MKEVMNSLHKQKRLGRLRIKEIEEKHFKLNLIVGLIMPLATYADAHMLKKLNNLPKSASCAIEIKLEKILCREINKGKVTSIVKYLFIEIEQNNHQ